MGIASGRARHFLALFIVPAGVLLALRPCAFALDPTLDISQYAHTAWKIREGFAKGSIYSIAQTQDGYLWLGTEFGLLRFDGVRNVPWQPAGDQHLPTGPIRSLLVARDGTLWIGADNGLASWKNGNLTRYAELTGEYIVALLEDREGAMWVGGVGVPTGKLCAIHKGSVRCYGEDGTLGRGVVGLYEDSKGNLWAGVENGLWRWSPGPPKFYPLPGNPDGLQALGEGADGALLVGWKGGIHRFVDGKTEAHPLPSISGQFKANRILRDRDGGLWIGTQTLGFVHVHQGRADLFTSANGLSGDDIRRLALFEDSEGNIWVATSNGLDRFREFAVATLTTKQGLSNAVVVSVLATRDGSIWLGTNGGLNRWINGQIKTYRIGTRLNDVPNSLFQDKDGRIWVSTGRGIGYLEKNGFVRISGVPGGNILSISQDKAGNLWVANETRGLFRLSPRGEVQQIPWARLGHKDHASVLATDPSQRGLWIGFFLGGTYFEDGQIRTSYTVADGLGEGRVSDFLFDHDSTLWASTEGGLSRLKNGRIATLTSKNGLPCDTVHWMMEDDDHSFWLYMPCGLVRIDRSEMDGWAAAADQGKNTRHIVQVTVFDSSDGVRSLATGGHYSPQVAKSSDGKLWFLPWDGVSIVDPQHLHLNKLPPPVCIEQIAADHQTYQAISDSNGSVRLPPLLRDLQIDYTALSLVVPEKVLFRYKLEGWDRDWQEAGTRRQAFYSNLPPRHYTFRVKACNNSGVWNEGGTFLDFSVASAYYQTNWFRALCVAAFLGLVVGLYELRVHQVRREERKLRETIEMIPTMAWVTRPDGTNQFVNRRWLEYTGLSETGAEGEGWKGLVHPEDVDRYVRRWLAAVASGESFEEEVRVRGVNGEYRWFLSRAVALRGKRGKILRWYGVSTDIEDRKRAEQLQADLAHTNRVSILGELAASISHELKQPIAATLLNAGACKLLLKRDKPDLEKTCDAVDRIVKDSKRATEIIERLRSLYKKSPPQRELVDVNEIIREMVMLLRGEANRYAVSMRTDVAADLPKVTADRVQLQQVLMNLMLNGIEAMKDTGGVLTVKSQPEDGYAHISVSDAGVGLPADEADRIFDAFFTTKPQGSGMGLAISRSIVESHGGRLWATSNDGRGATFHFTLLTAAQAVRLPAMGT